MQEQAAEEPLRVDAGNPVWQVVWRAAYVVARRWGRLVRLFVALGVSTYGQGIVELRLVGRRTGRPRPLLLTLIRWDGNWYVGHPNGPRPWLANLASAESVVMALPRSGSVVVRGTPVHLGHERDEVIGATAIQQPWPGRLLYSAAQSHILRAGIYYRLERLPDADGVVG
jgi:hypothetical protein